MTEHAAGGVGGARELAGRVAIVTGGSRGLGLAISKALGAAGAHLCVVSRKEAAVEHAVAELNAGGAAATGLALDITARGAAKEMVARAQQICGRIDVLVNCAGVFVYKPFMQLDETEWRASLETNLTAPFLLTQEVARAMVAQGHGGAIINITSVHGAIGDPNAASTVAAKFGLEGLTRATAEALRAHDIRVNAIAPGAIEPQSAERSGASPRQRVTQADVASLAVYLASEKARTITGTTIELFGVTRPALVLT